MSVVPSFLHPDEDEKEEYVDNICTYIQYIQVHVRTRYY